MIVDSSIECQTVKGWAQNVTIFRQGHENYCCLLDSCNQIQLYHQRRICQGLDNWEIVYRPSIVDLKNLLTFNPYNGFREVMNERVSPSDIDA